MMLVFFLSNMNSTVLPSRHLFLELSMSKRDVGTWKRDACDFLPESTSGQDEVTQYSSAV